MFSVLLAIYYLIRYFTSRIGIAGWTTIILLQLLFSGLLLFSIGIVGEYLIRILNETKKFPNFIIRTKKM